MKIVFLFDQADESGKIVATESIPFVTTPDKLNLRNISDSMCALGVVFEQADESGEKKQVFRQIINFPVVLAPPKPQPPTVPVGTVTHETPAPTPAVTAPAEVPAAPSVAGEAPKAAKKAKKSQK